MTYDNFIPKSFQDLIFLSVLVYIGSTFVYSIDFNARQDIIQSWSWKAIKVLGKIKRVGLVIKVSR